ncbi:MAG: hypothetical protein Kow0037_08620 [Calditrichia bacterium]
MSVTDFIRVLMISLLFCGAMQAQEVSLSNSEKWKLSGRVQLQHLVDTQTKSDAEKTNNGFRMRRVRFQIKSQLNNFVSAKIQVEARDNSPRLKDGELKIKLFSHNYLRAGQFKIPVWREELRSSGKLFLVERSAAAEFLAENYLSARHIGIEFGGKTGNISYRLNYSNGAGEGGREDAGRSKSETVNNGKMVSARLEGQLNDAIAFGLSAAFNRLGDKVNGADKSGMVRVVAPDFSYRPVENLELEGGAAFGKLDKNYLMSDEDAGFVLLDLTGRWSAKFQKEVEAFGGLSVWEIAAGISRVEPNDNLDGDDYLVYRFGPAVYFGKTTRLQINVEVEDYAASGAETITRIRSQLTVNL